MPLKSRKSRCAKSKQRGSLGVFLRACDTGNSGKEPLLASEVDDGILNLADSDGGESFAFDVAQEEKIATQIQNNNAYSRFKDFDKKSGSYLQSVYTGRSRTTRYRRKKKSAALLHEIANTRRQHNTLFAYFPRSQRAVPEDVVM
ncbi:hypothetical protein BGZ73_001329, partial [Actinomortierella ambigua]